MRRLSILIPAYNEGPSVRKILDRVAKVHLPEAIEKEIVIVNDASTDDTWSVLQEYQKDHPELEITLFSQLYNQGKGAALHKAIELAKGDFVIIQDADLEYDPEDYLLLLKPILRGEADVVYGSRFMGGEPHRILFFWHSIGNKVLTFWSNAFTNLNLTDMETCYKMVRADIIKSLLLKERRFGFEPELTAKLARIKEIRIYEVGISYYGRTYAQGKKIGWKDGFRAMWCILKYNLWSRNYLKS
jgi:glycosyltransferase involved in cell wall biosynthesis